MGAEGPGSHHGEDDGARITNRRWAIEIIRDILRRMVEMEGLGKGQIRLITGLNFYQSQSYISFLAERGFITEIEQSPVPNGNTLLQITVTGRQLLSLLEAVLSFMGFNDGEELPEEHLNRPKVGERGGRVRSIP